MADTVSAETRSRIMSRIRSKHTRLEREYRARLARCGVRGWRMHAADLPGTPDFVFRETGLAVFVDSCFWHGCPAHYRPPKTCRAWWAAKIARKKARDEEADRLLRHHGWHVLRLRECAL